MGLCRGCSQTGIFCSGYLWEQDKDQDSCVPTSGDRGHQLWHLGLHFEEIDLEPWTKQEEGSWFGQVCTFNRCEDPGWDISKG